jgi:RNA polymerase sigma-70 factor (ECF subfamily)
MEAEDFTRTFREYLVPLSKFVARRVDAARVDDVCSEIFLIAFTKRSSAPTGHELAWLYAIGGNVINNLRRKDQTSAKLFAALSTPRFAPSAESIAVADVALAAAWKQLKPNEQGVLALTALDGLSVSQAATVLGLSANATSVRLNRARTHLAQLLAETE